MVFNIFGGCSSYANDKNVRECERTNGTYASYCGCADCLLTHLCNPDLIMLHLMNKSYVQRSNLISQILLSFLAQSSLIIEEK